MNRIVQTLIIASVTVIVLSLLAAAVVPGPIPPPPSPPGKKMRGKFVLVEFPFGLTKTEVKTLQELDSILGDLEQLRERIKLPRLVLPGPAFEKDKKPLTIRDYERKFRDLAKRPGAKDDADWQVWGTISVHDAGGVGALIVSPLHRGKEIPTSVDEAVSWVNGRCKAGTLILVKTNAGGQVRCNYLAGGRKEEPCPRAPEGLK